MLTGKIVHRIRIQAFLGVSPLVIYFFI